MIRRQEILREQVRMHRVCLRRQLSEPPWESYRTSGGLHGVGISVVNALAANLEVEVVRNHRVFRQSFSRGVTTSALETGEKVKKKSGTKVTFNPDPLIFGENKAFKPVKLLKIARSKTFGWSHNFPKY